MNKLQQQLEANLSAAYDRLEAHVRRGNTSVEDLAAMTPITMDLVFSQWGAGLEVKTRHDLMKASIDAIR